MNTYNFYQPNLKAIYYKSDEDDKDINLYTHFHLYNIVCVFDGTLHIKDKNESFTLKKDEIILLNPYTNVEIDIKINKFEVLILNIDPNVFKNTLDETDVFRAFEFYTKKINFESFSTPLIKHLLNSIKDCVIESKGTYHVISRVVALICELNCEHDKQKGIQKIPESNVTLKTIIYIRNHFTEDLTLDSVSNKIGISKNSISRICRAMQGMSFLEYLHELRLQKAKTLLERENLSIKNIAILCGFKSYNSFYKAYIKRYGSVPSNKSKKIQEKSYWPFESANQPFLNQ